MKKWDVDREKFAKRWCKGDVDKADDLMDALPFDPSMDWEWVDEIAREFSNALGIIPEELAELYQLVRKVKLEEPQ